MTIMLSYEEIYNKWISLGQLSNDDIPYIQRATPDAEYLPEFLANKVDNTESVSGLLQVTAFANYLLNRYGNLIGTLQNFINSIIAKLKTLAQNLSGVFFHVEVGLGVHISITFQVDAIQTK